MPGTFVMFQSPWLGALYITLVDTSSPATIVRSDVVPAGLQLRTVTGALAPMLRRGVVTILSIDCQLT